MAVMDKMFKYPYCFEYFSADCFLFCYLSNHQIAALKLIVAIQGKVWKISPTKKIKIKNQLIPFPSAFIAITITESNKLLLYDFPLTTWLHWAFLFSISKAQAALWTFHNNMSHWSGGDTSSMKILDVVAKPVYAFPSAWPVPTHSPTLISTYKTMLKSQFTRNH